MKVISVIALILVIIGALNWGAVGFFNFNFVDAIFAHVPNVARIVYAIVGLAGLWSIGLFKHCCGPCSKSGSEGGGCCSK